jgi:hypothetical protein
VGIARKVLGGAQRPASVAAEDPYGIGAWLKGAGPMPTPIAAEIQAYHGSPHDFEKFLLEKIGTGEGAQAYGHGLYFAENPEVAAEYRKQLAGAPKRVIEGQPLDTTNPDHLAATLLYTFKGDKVKVLRQLEQDIKTPELAAKRDVYQRTVDLLKSDKPLPSVSFSQPGKTYQVSIKADPDQFLDWDKPLSQQPPEVQKALEKHGFVSWNPDTEAPKGDSNSRNMTGAAIYNSLAAEKWPSGAPRFSGNPMKAQATEVLRQAGIPGIKYLDQGSRGAISRDRHVLEMIASDGHTVSSFEFPTADEATKAVPSIQKQLKGLGPLTPKITLHPAQAGTSNYVVFDDKLIDILKKYAVAGAVGGSLASLGQPQEQK